MYSMKSTALIAVSICLTLLLFVSNSLAQSTVPVEIFRTEKSPVIDGILDDYVWSLADSFDVFISTRPVFGQEPSQRTVVYLSYDSANLYVAFNCYDTNPELIRAHLVERDNTSEQDWAGIVLDVNNEESNGIFLLLTPRGVQTDGTTDAERNVDLALDMKYRGEAQINEHGYTVEMAIPFSSIHPPANKNLTMGFQAARYISHYSQEIDYPEIDPIRGGILSQFKKIKINNITTATSIEILPEVTYQNIADKSQEQAGNTSMNNRGISLRFGMGGSHMGAATWRPDFSHLESDASQVDANLRNALYYQEKRPFFLEGKEDFSLAATNNSSPLAEVVHTRSIVQPATGIRYGGKIGKKQRISMLYARDDYRGQENLAADVGILRYLNRMNGDNYFGAITTLRKNRATYNSVSGFDGSFRSFPRFRIEYHALLSATDTGNRQQKKSGYATGLYATYKTSELELSGGIHSVSRNFKTEVGYLGRQGVTQYPFFAAYTIPLSWGPFVSVMPSYYGLFKTDHPSGLTENRHTFNVRTNLLKDGYIQVSKRFADEVYEGQLFNNEGMSLSTQIRVTSELKLAVNMSSWSNAFYNAENHFSGDSHNYSLGSELRLGSHFIHGLDYKYEQMNRHDDGSRVYKYRAIRNNIVFQFNRKWSCRSILDYNHYKRTITSDYLLSYKHSPGSVFYLGYGSDHVDVEHFSYYKGVERERRLFLKASYLWGS